MSCPRCQMPIANPDEAFCPRCGYALQPSQPGAPASSVPQVDAPFAPPVYPAPGLPQMPSGAYPSYGAPPSGSLYGPDMPPPPPPYPPYPGYPPYPPYGVAAPSTIPLAPYPTWAPASPPKHRNNALVVLAIVLLIAIIAGSGGALYLVANGQHGPNISLAPIPTATPSYNVIFQDPLTSNTNGWFVDSHCFFTEGSYHVKDGFLCYAPAGTFTNGDVSVQVKQISGPLNYFYGMVVRGAGFDDPDVGDYYALFINGVGDWQFSKFVRYVRTDLVPYVTTTALHRGLDALNTLEVRMQASHFDFYLNGIKVGQADDATFGAGYAGVIGNPSVEVAFNTFDAKVIA